MIFIVNAQDRACFKHELRQMHRHRSYALSMPATHRNRHAPHQRRAR